jgi:uncharacterized protein HemX
MRGRYQGGQGGSLAGFIIVGVLLALVLVGGLYGLNRYNAQKAAEKTTASQQDKKTTTNIPNDRQQTAKKDESNKNSSQTDKKTGTQATNNDSTPSSSSSSNSQVAQSSVLPHTGPSDMTLSLLAITLLGFAGAHFVQSRRSRI